MRLGDVPGKGSFPILGTLDDPKENTLMPSPLLCPLLLSLPLAFTPPAAAPSCAPWTARVPGVAVALSPEGVDMALGANGARLRMRLHGANKHAALAGQRPLPGRVNFLVGSDPAHWRTGVVSYSQVECKNVLPGVDAVYYGTGRQLEYDLRVAAHVPTRRLCMTFDGAKSLRVGPNGDLRATLSGGASGQTIVWRAPSAYQTVNGRRIPVQARFVRRGTNDVAFQIGRYNPARPLVIDPKLAYSSYLGGQSFDIPQGGAVDPTGTAYITGYTFSSNFPTTPGALRTHGGGSSVDGFVAKVNPKGTALVYSTYLGGTSYDAAVGIAVGTDGSAYVTGRTSSTDFPLVHPIQNANRGGNGGDAFVCRLNAQGSALLYSTYLGGTDTDAGSGISVGSDGSAYVTGMTASTNFPVTAGSVQTHDRGGDEAFVTKINPQGTAFAYSTYLGGDFDDAGTAIAVDSVGNAYVTGATASDNFPTVNPLQAHFGGHSTDAFVSKINPTGNALTYSTYLGGNGDDIGHGVAVDGEDNAIVTGTTSSPNFPVTPGVLQARYGGGQYEGDAFVVKLTPAGTAFVYATFLGGKSDDDGYAIAADNAGNAYVTGTTLSSNFPVTGDAYQPHNGAEGRGAFVSVVNPTGTALAYGTYLGDGAYGYGIGIDLLGSIGVMGETIATDFPTTPNAFQKNPGDYSNNGDGFVARLTLPDARVLWDKSDGTATLWNISSVGATSYSPYFGPLPGWKAAAIADGPDGLTRLLWDRSDGAVAIWNVDAAGNAAYLPTYGPLAGWHGASISVGPANDVHLLWANVNGSIVLWTFPGNGGKVVYGPAYGPLSGWTARNISTGADGATRLLWTNTDGRAVVWTFSSTGKVTYGTAVGPIAGWHVQSMSVGPDNSVHLLWDKTDGSFTLWTTKPNGTTTYGPSGGPAAGWTATAIASGSDNALRLLWNHAPDGAITLWTLAPGGAFTYAPTFGPISEWSGVALTAP